MSNYLAIATVTATIQRVLQSAIQADMEGALVTTVKPSDVGKGTPEHGVNIFLYQVITNPALNNIDATPFRSKGNPVKRQAALDLYYMLSFYGNDNLLQPQQLLGSVVRTLNEKRIITPQMIRETIEDSSYSFLGDSNLADQIQQMNIVPLDLNLEDLSKTWSVFFQTPYILSIAYKVLVVMVEGEESVKRALPVRDRNLGKMIPFPHQPLITEVVAAGGKFKPILADSTLLIKGQNLQSNLTKVRIAEVEVTPESVQKNQITLPLASIPTHSLKAGVQSLQVIHQISPGTESVSHNQVESNVAPFVLCPTVKAVSIDNIEASDEEHYSAELTVQVNLPLGKKQRVVLALNEWSTDNPTAYQFDAPKRRENTNSLTVPITNVTPGEYLVRLMVDGAESQLSIDENRNSPTFDWYIAPKVEIR